jgi:hypothetical protein
MYRISRHPNGPAGGVTGYAFTATVEPISFVVSMHSLHSGIQKAAQAFWNFA